jgi:CRISP-associated protein Cas1
MLKGRLGLDDTRIPHKSRHGLVYVDYARLSIDAGCLVLTREEAGEITEIPHQMISAILLGPGTSITHDAMRHLSTHGTAVVFVGTDGIRCYTAPPVYERDADLARKQATYWASEPTRLLVARRMYQKRFGEVPRVSSMEMLRGFEAQRIKHSYGILASTYGIEWKGRRYDPSDPGKADVPNQSINHTVTALEACVTIAVQATATLGPLGFLHEASSKAWILDLCDLYRTTVTVPLAFTCAKRVQDGETSSLDSQCRRMVSRYVRENGFIDTVIDDIKEILA